MTAPLRASAPRSSSTLGAALVAFVALGCASRAPASRTPGVDAADPPAASGASDPRDVTRPGAPPPRYRASTNGPLVAITRNAYGAYAAAPRAPQLGAFNVGIELAQLAFVGVAMIPLVWMARHRRYPLVVVRGGSLAIAAMGCVWLAERSLGL